MKAEQCVKCGKAHESGHIDRGVAAWDGKGNTACWRCFRRWDWRSFPVPPTREEFLPGHPGQPG